MTIRDPFTRALLAALALGLPAAGCGDRPAAPGGGPAPAGLPAGHPPVGGAAPGASSALSGTIELSGELATLEQGFVFVIGREPASGRMVLVEKLSLADARRADDGIAELDFALATAHALEGGAVSEVALEVRVDRDGLADGQDDVLARATGAARVGDSGLRLVLDDATRTAVPLR